MHPSTLKLFSFLMGYGISKATTAVLHLMTQSLLPAAGSHSAGGRGESRRPERSCVTRQQRACAQRGGHAVAGEGTAAATTAAGGGGAAAVQARGKEHIQHRMQAKNLKRH